MRKDRGFTLIEIIVVLAVMSILVGLTIPLVYKNLEQARHAATEKGMEELKIALIGDPDLKSNGMRISYGFIGDMGILPGQGSNDKSVRSLKELVVQGAYPSYKFIQDINIGGGWQGPYLQVGASTADTSEEILLDAFGEYYLYEVKNPSGLKNEEYVAKIVSAGEDKIIPSEDDIAVKILKKESFAQVYGYVKTEDNMPVANVLVTLFYPDATILPTDKAGIITKQIAYTDGNGFYQFSDIPFGIRSITVQPGLQYADGSAKTTENGSNVIFSITNYSATDMVLLRVVVDYNIINSRGKNIAFYEELRLGGTSFFKSKKRRNGPGETVSVFPPLRVKGSGKPFQPLVVHVNESSTMVKDISPVKGLKAGDSIQCEILRFQDSRGHGGNPVDVTGIEFTVYLTHPDGTQSVINFTPAVKEVSSNNQTDTGGGIIGNIDRNNKNNKKRL